MDWLALGKRVARGSWNHRDRGPNRWRTLAPRRADQILAWGWPRDIGIILTALAMTAVGDMLVVLAAKGSTKRAFGMHGLTAVFMVLAGILLAVGAP